jgi:phosphate-selective porin OprO/OprP
VGLWLATGAGSTAQAQTATNIDVPALLQRLDELEQKVKVLERKRELDVDATAEKAKVTPTVSLGANGLQVRSADSNFTMNVRGYLQVDGRFYTSEKTVNDTLLLRRVRPIVEGTVFNNFDYRFMAELASGTTSPGTNNDGFILDAYANVRLWPQLQFQAGKYKAPVGLERLQSTANLPFMETGFTTQLTPNYDVGAMVHNGLFKNTVDYAVGIFNGVADGASGDLDSADEGKEMVARVFTQPFMSSDSSLLRGLGFGVGGTYGYRAGPTRGYVTPGQQTFFSYSTAAANSVTFSGDQYRIVPQAYYYYGPFGILGEYALSSQEVNQFTPGGNTSARFNNTAWQVVGSWFLTGEQNSFKQVAPLHPVGLEGGGWGAFELVGRVGQLRLDNGIFPLFASATSAQEATSWGVGINWLLNRNFKLQLDYEQTSFRNGVVAPGSATAQDEKVILVRAQIGF